VACITTYQQLLFRNLGYIHATIADCPTLLEHTTSNEELFHNYGYINTTTDRVDYKRKATDNFVAEAHKQDNELGLGVQKTTRGQPVKN
jgi:hypothetical protein